ncbi:hypothetical protein [Parvimonas micra]|uniref:hypothetical protein n=1 Tax=Parvimonas micra TaxID=33033 RepID=UPI00135F178E|nr:hypothetical protein [Parvimonas micra]
MEITFTSYSTTGLTFLYLIISGIFVKISQKINHETKDVTTEMIISYIQQFPF